MLLRGHMGYLVIILLQNKAAEAFCTVSQAQEHFLANKKERNAFHYQQVKRNDFLPFPVFVTFLFFCRATQLARSRIRDRTRAPGTESAKS